MMTREPSTLVRGFAHTYTSTDMDSKDERELQDRLTDLLLDATHDDPSIREDAADTLVAITLLVQACTQTRHEINELIKEKGKENLSPEEAREIYQDCLDIVIQGGVMGQQILNGEHIRIDIGRNNGQA